MRTHLHTTRIVVRITVADKVNVVSIRNVVWHIDVFSRALWEVVSQIAKGSFQVDYKE